MVPAGRKEKHKGVVLFAQRSQSFFFFPHGGNSLNTIFFGIEETLTLTKFQNIYLSKAFLDFEADVKEEAHGIEEEKNPSMEAWG